MIHFKDAFTKDECEKIIALFISPVAATVGVEKQINPSIRKSELVWLENTPDNAWIFDRLNLYASKAKTNLGIQEPLEFGRLQLTKYNVGSFYSWHKDSNSKQLKNRILSLVVQLSPPENYTGCELQSPKATAIKHQGSITFFRSNVLHQVTKLESGERFTLVTWMTCN